MLKNNMEVIKASNNLFAAKCKLEKAFPNYLWDEKRIELAKMLINLAQKVLTDNSEIKDIKNQLSEVNKFFKDNEEILF